MPNDQGDNYYGDESATFGDRVAAAREALGLSQPDLARRLGVRLKTVVAWENDAAEPRANRLQMLAGILNVSVMWLLTGAGDGLDAPHEESPLESDIQDVLIELRRLRGDQARLNDRLGALEKRLRMALKASARG
jgi:HTH-type transcriptional regulator, cell division transcriptional repressor